MTGTTHDHRRVITIDGPVAAGKSTVARELADRVGATLFDTGTLYRAVTLAALRREIDSGASDELAELAMTRRIDIARPTPGTGRLYDVSLDGEDVTELIRDPAVDRHVSAVSAHPAVRAALLPVQRDIASRGTVVMVGRDTGSVVVPNAGLKVYLDASPDERARRRHAEIVARGGELTYDEVLADLRRRDAFDAMREASPLTVADGAVVIRSDGKTVAALVAEIAALALDRWERSAAAGDAA
ncbi:MAG: (d)CMP kinase [Chloroflexota bacterium]|nr:(d)CMP kinase [Chloroflexota bacterium]